MSSTMMIKSMSRLFEVALPQRWRTTLKAKLRELTIGPNKSFIVLSSRARTLQSLINFDTSLSSENAVTYVSDFDLAEYVVLGVKNETIHGDIAKFALLDATPFSYSAFENRVASFDEVTIRKTTHRAPRTSPSNHAPSNSPPDPVAWRVHAYLDSQDTESFQTPRRPVDYKPPKPHGPSSSSAGRPTQPPAGRPPFRSTSLAAIADSSDSDQPPSNTDYVEVVEAIDSDQQTFVDAAAEEDLPPDLTAGDWATFKEIDEILSDNVANVKEDETSVCGSEYCSDLGCDPFVNTLPDSSICLLHNGLPAWPQSGPPSQHLNLVLSSRTAPNTPRLILPGLTEPTGFKNPFTISSNQDFNTTTPPPPHCCPV
ncbi:hypothetical protein PSTG_00539 [Puccinia striiformis f. sp. tritici PST-78]|uniref:Uncharacterized protein n=1 Tax=Puccinia striiformis f. sp. tritici PST-78 TaxID=1165861 RepID=A0A0L0W5Y2_9BASI|nr:hypothetical protein PSTG_00539 [Puccinia striiformis f. sp. tritici PST-78]